MKRLTPERELDIEFMAKQPDYKCKAWEALRELWEDREILKQQLKEEDERR